MSSLSVQLSDDSASLLGESPYIGKGRFHENERSVEHLARAKPQEVRYASVNSNTRTSTVTDPHATVTQGRLDSVVVDGDDVSEARANQQQIDVELQDRLQALAEGRLCGQTE